MSLRLALSVLFFSVMQIEAVHCSIVRFKAELIDVGPNEVANKLYQQWGNIVAQQIKIDIEAILADVQPTDRWTSLKEFDFVFKPLPRTLTLEEREQRWKSLELLQIIEGIPIATSDKDLRARVTVYVGELKGSLTSNTFLLDEEMQAGATLATSDILVLITLYALIENALQFPDSDRLVCALIAHAYNYIKDVQNPTRLVSVITANSNAVVGSLKPILDFQRTERSCPAVN